VSPLNGDRIWDGSAPEKIFKEILSLKNAGFYAFLFLKLLVAGNWDQAVLIDPLGG